MSRSRASIVSLLAALVLLACGPPTPDRIVVITLDTTRADALGAYGQRLPTTPRIDAMAADGLLFENAVTSSPSTLPSHATLFTGKQPYAHGVRSNSGYRLAAGNETLAERLQARGWRTHAEVAAPVMSAQTELGQGFDLYRDPAAVDAAVDAIERQARTARFSRPAEAITERGLAFVRANADRPFFLWLHYFDPHHPHEPPEPFRSALNPYFAEIRRADHHVGLVLDELERLGLRERALVVLTADHGEGMGQHGEETHSFFVYDSTMRIPLVFWGGESVPRGRRASGLVRAADVTPTLLDLAGLPPLEGVQGVSLRPVFEDPRLDLGLHGYGESAEPLLTFGSSVLRFLRVGPWKYIHKIEPELYHLERDPREVVNLASSRPEVLAEMQGALTTLIGAAPAPPEGAEMALEGERLAELQALGYLAAPSPAGLQDEWTSLEVRGPDPSRRIEAIRSYSKAVALVNSRRSEQALPILRELKEANPDSAVIARAWVDALHGVDAQEELEAALLDGLRLEPDSVRYRILLAGVVEEREPERAERLLREAVEGAGCRDRKPTLHLAYLLQRRGRGGEQRALLEAQVPACPDVPAFRNALAWLLATSSEAHLRDGPQAVRLAEEAVAATGGSHSGYIETLAAALAETGDFERALVEQRRALGMIEGREVPPGVIASYRRHLASLEAGRPVREP